MQAPLMMPLTELRIEAEALVRQLPRLSLKNAQASATHMGSSGRRRAGPGEDFWEYRRHDALDDVSRIDWRRSARGDTLFVRETELETARTIYLYVDPAIGFDWSGTPDRMTKADRARLLFMAIAALLSQAGEDVGVLSATRSTGFGPRALERVYQQLVTPKAHQFIAPKRAGLLIIASDFYQPMSEWEAKLAPIAEKSRKGLLLAISDPVEIEFPFAGRVQLTAPGERRKRTLGRAQIYARDYKKAYEDNRRALDTLAHQLGWQVIPHSTGEPSLDCASRLHHHLQNLVARR